MAAIETRPVGRSTPQRSASLADSADRRPSGPCRRVRCISRPRWQTTLHGVLETRARPRRCGRDLADAVADDRVGLDAPRAPERGERDLDGEQRRLGDTRCRRAATSGSSARARPAATSRACAAKPRRTLDRRRGTPARSAAARAPCPATARPGRRRRRRSASRRRRLPVAPRSAVLAAARQSSARAAPRRPRRRRRAGGVVIAARRAGGVGRVGRAAARRPVGEMRANAGAVRRAPPTLRADSGSRYARSAPAAAAWPLARPAPPPARRGRWCRRSRTSSRRRCAAAAPRRPRRQLASARRPRRSQRDVRVRLVRSAGAAGSARCCSASTTLIRPAMPAAASRWPMFVFTEPTSSGRSACAAVAEHRAQRVHLDRIAERRAGAVRLHVADVAPARCRRRASALADHRLLRRPVRRGQAVACGRPG